MLLNLNILKTNLSLITKPYPWVGLHQPITTATVLRRSYPENRQVTGLKKNAEDHQRKISRERSRFSKEELDKVNWGSMIQGIMSKDDEIKKFSLPEKDNENKYHPEDKQDRKPRVEQNIQDVINRAGGDDLDTTFANLLAVGKLANISNSDHIDEPVDLTKYDPLAQGHKFGLPDLPIPKNANFKYREDPVVQQVTNLLMRDGKKSVAQRNMSYILNALRKAPPPKFNPLKPLVPGHPPAHHLPLDPVGYLTLALDSVAPLLRIRSERGAAGGGAALPIPVPLGQRQRRRQAVMWILDSVNKRVNHSSGRGTFAQRFADEVVNVVEGKSSAWEKRLMVHKTGTTARNNINFRRRR